MRMEQIAAVIHRCHQPHTSMLKNDRSADPRGAPRFSKTLITRSSRWVSDLLRLSFFWPARFFRNRLPFLKLGRRATPPPAQGKKKYAFEPHLEEYRAPTNSNSTFPASRA
jgi:hypothetical protein